MFLERSWIETDNNEALVGFWHRFVPFHDLIWSRWSYGGFVEATVGTNFTLTVGVAGWLFVAASMLTLWRNKSRNWAVWVLVGAFGITVWLVSTASIAGWRLLPGLAMIQFPWRLLGAAVIASILVMASTYATSRELPLASQLLVVGAALFVGYDLLFHGHPIGTINNSDLMWREYQGTASSFDEFKAKGFDRHKNLALTDPLVFIEPTTGTEAVAVTPLSVEMGEWTGSVKKFTLRSKRPLWAVMKVMYFPGWTATVNGAKQEINHTSPFYPGRVIIPLEPGEQKVELKMGETTVARMVGDGLSLLGLGWFAVGAVMGVRSQVIVKK